MLRRLELKREQFEHPKEELCETTSELQHNCFLMAESKSYIHDQQSCKLIATGLPFHMSTETAPSPSIWNTDQQSIYYHLPSLPPPEPPPILPSHGFVKILVGLLMMGGSQILEIGYGNIRLLRRGNVNWDLFMQKTLTWTIVQWHFFPAVNTSYGCSFLGIYFFFSGMVIHLLLVSIRDFDSELISWTIILVLDFSEVHTTGIYKGLQSHISRAAYAIVGG